MRDSRGRRESGLGYLIDRRGFLGAAAALALAPAALVRAAELETALEESGLVYVSPLLADGSESTCHGEVWFGWIDGAVVIITGAEGWKARALGRGLESARLWVGDHGRWKKLVTRNEAFRAAPSFDEDVLEFATGQLCRPGGNASSQPRRHSMHQPRR